MAFDVRPIEASGTIYIRADGSIDPPTAKITIIDEITYTFTDNIFDRDRDVDIFDIVRMAAIYGAELPDTRYNRLCDIDLDGDIDIFDIAAAGNYGRSW